MGTSYTAHPEHSLFFCIIHSFHLSYCSLSVFSPHVQCSFSHFLPLLSPRPSKFFSMRTLESILTQLLFSALLQLDLLHYQCWGGREGGRAEVGFMYVDEERGRRKWQRGCWGRENCRMPNDRVADNSWDYIFSLWYSFTCPLCVNLARWHEGKGH